MRAFLDLPLDVLYCITDTLACLQDFDSLTSCSMVCKDFRPLCTRHMFAKIILTDNSGRSRPTLPVDQIQKLLEKNPHLAAYIQELKIVYEPVAEWNNHNLPIVLDQLQNVVSLSINTPFATSDVPINWQMLSDALKNSLERLIGAPHLKYLQVDDIVDFPLPWMLATSASLKTLLLKRIGTPPDHLHPIALTSLQPNAPVPRLHGFSINLDSHTSRLAALSFMTLKRPQDGSPVISFASLQDLILFLKTDDRNQVKLMNMYLSATTGLRDLKLAVSHFSQETAIVKLFEHIHPSSLKTLESITLVFSAWDRYPYFAAYDDLAILASAKCPLQIFEFSVDILCLNLLPASELDIWSPLAEMLTLANFPTLREVYIRIDIRAEDPDNLASEVLVLAKAAFINRRDSGRLAQFSLDVRPLPLFSAGD